MTKKTVNAGMCTYTDVSGARRIATAGEEVDVHPDDVGRFNKVNGIITVESKKPAAQPKKPRGRPRKT